MPDAEKIIDTAIQEWDQIALRTSPSTPLATHIVRVLREEGLLTEQWAYYPGHLNGERAWISGGGSTIAEGYVQQYMAEGGEVIRRRVGPWEPVEGDPR